MATVQEIFDQQLPTKLRTQQDICAAVNAVIVFDLSGDGGGQWVVDCTKAGGAVMAGSVDNPKVTVLMTADDFVTMMAGKLDPQQAFLTGKLKVKGDMGTALKLGKLLG